MPQLTDDEILEAALEQQIPEAQSDKADEPGEAVQQEQQPEVLWLGEQKKSRHQTPGLQGLRME